MKKNYILIILAVFTVSLFAQSKSAQVDRTWTEANGYIYFECEDTPSPLGKWVLRVPGDPLYKANSSGDKHLEFTGNKASGGSANSPLVYKFSVTTAGNYRVITRACRRLEDGEKDHCNDVYIRMTGDFTSGNNVPLSELTKNNKYFGARKEEWAWAYKLESHSGKFNEVVYSLKTGEEYTLTISGRSQRRTMDYILLYEVSRYSFEQAQALTPQSSSLSNNSFQQNNINIYPNPTNGELKLTGLNEETEISVLNISGMTIKNIVCQNKIDISELTAGIYFIKIANQNQIIRAIKQ